MRELALKILHQVWKTWFDRVECATAPGNATAASTATKWQNHGEFRDTLVQILQKVTELFPNNASYTASAIKLQTLAARYFVKHADSFDDTES